MLRSRLSGSQHLRYDHVQSDVLLARQDPLPVPKPGRTWLVDGIADSIMQDNVD